jgi:hypothetical protein
MQLRKVFLAVLALVLLPAASWAAPTISGVSGTVSNGESITISGGSFGSGPTVSFFDDFEKGTNGGALLTGAGSAETGTWTSIDVPDVTYTNAQKVSGSLALYSSPYTPYGMGGRGSVTIPSSTQIFFSFWVRADAWPNNGVNVSWKVLWPMGTGTTNHDLACPSYQYTGGGHYAGNGTAWTSFDTAPPLSLNTWQRQWVWINDSSSDSIKSQYLSSGGVVTNLNLTGQSIYSSGSFLKFLIPGNIEIATSPHVWHDDVYIATGANAQARVEIGNAATYNNCTNLTILVPTSWSASSIAATVYQGSFADSAGAYLYVTDSAGAVNSTGYSVTFGEGGGDTTPPVMSGPLPSGVQACTSNPRSVTIAVTTDEAATCKYSASDVAYDSMGGTFSTTGGTSHSQALTLSCAAGYTYYSRCMDAAGNQDATSATHSFSLKDLGHTAGMGGGVWR